MKTKQISLTLAMIAISFTAFAQVGIGTTSPDPSSALDIESTDKGLLIPRMITAERTAISSPAEGLQVFDTTTKSLWYHNGTLWVETQAADNIAASYGDIKQSLIKVDHNGWILLNGRLKTSLSASQQARLAAGAFFPGASIAQTTGNGALTATYLADIDGNNNSVGGIGGNTDNVWGASDLPDLSHAHGARSGDPDRNHTHNGATSTNGNHNHNIPGQNTGLNFNINDGNNFLTSDEPSNTSVNSAFNGDHAHTFTTQGISNNHRHNITVDPANPGGPNGLVFTTNRTLDVNTFVYLGL
jgi:hypothetical protein